MKSILTILLAIASCSVAVGQNKDNIFVDAGINEAGISATYDRKLARHFELGGGINTHYFKYEPFAASRSAVYVDLRPYWKFGKSTLFVFVDVGAAYNAVPKRDSETVTAVGLYNTVGLGYHYRINKRGMGPYVSLGLYGYFENVHTARAVFRGTGAEDYGVEEAWAIFSLGFKF